MRYLVKCCNREFQSSRAYLNHARTHGNPEPSRNGNVPEGAETRSSLQFEFGVKPSSVELGCLFFDGISVPEIAALFEVPLGSMQRHVTKVLLTCESLTHMYVERRMSAYEIAEIVNRSRDAVVRSLHRFRIHVRRSVPVTWSHQLLIKRLKELRIQVDEFQINYQAVGTRYLIDIAFPEVKLAVEVDGRSHFNDPDGYFGDKISYDLVRDADLLALGWHVLHITDHEIRYMLRECSEYVCDKLRMLTQERGATLQEVDDIVRHSEEIRR